MPEDVSVLLGNGNRTTAVHYAARAAWRPGALVVLAHGAGAGQRHPFMVAIAGGLAEAGIDVVTFNFLYAEQRRRAPDTAPALEDCFRRAIEAARGKDDLASRPLFIGGKSMGGRIATHLAAQGGDGIKGVIALGYPLHPPGKPEQPRIAHLPSIRAPMLIVQGERDPFGTPSELEPVIATMPAPVALHVVAGGDHSLSVRGRPRDDTFSPVLTVIGSWVREQLT
jgi:predicted alpha/beta-hydrolase family hydrolase